MRTLIRNVLLFPGCEPDEKPQFIQDACMHVEDDIIRYAGAACDAPAWEADAVIDGGGRLAMPGLTNAHTHLAMTLLRGHGSDMNLHDWLNKKIFPAEDRLTGERVRIGTRLAVMEQLRFGVTACADMYFFMDDVAHVIAETGMRAFLVRSMVGDDGTDSDPRMAESNALHAAWHGAENGRIRVGISPHAEYSTGKTLIRRVAEKARALDMRVHVHVSETQSEVEGCMARHGVSPVQYFAAMGLFDGPTLAAHCVWVDGRDIETLADKGVYVAHNPVSNLKLASGVMPLPAMLKKGVHVALGTDSASSNNTLNLWEELRLAALLHKGVTLDPLAVTVGQTLAMATVQGARAMGFTDVGMLKQGWRADCILLDIDTPAMTPCFDVAANVVYGAQGSDVWLTMVAGKVLYLQGEFTTIDRARVLREAQRAGIAMTEGL